MPTPSAVVPANLRARFFGWLELCVPGSECLEEMPPPLLVIRMVQERKLLAVELLKIQTSTLLESSDVNQPLEVGDEFRADKELFRQCAVDFLLEPYWSAC